MTVRRTTFAIAAAALITVAPARAQEPSSTPEAAPRVAVPRASRARAAGNEGGSREARAPRRVEREGSDTQQVQPRRPAPAPDAPVVAAANAEQQGGARSPRAGSGGRPAGGSSASGGRPSGGGPRSGPTSAGQAVPRQGGVRSPAVDGGRYGGQRYGQAVPRSSARRGYAGPNYYGHYGRRHYYGPTGLGYYHYDPWSWYVGYGWAGYGWPGYYGSLGYYGGAYGPYYAGGYGVYAAPYGYGGYGVYGGPYGYSIGGVRLKVNPKDAEVYVDGYYAGIVDDFDGTWQQLRLDDGAYRIEIRKAGLATLTFDVQIQPGRTITYHGDMLGVP